MIHQFIYKGRPVVVSGDTAPSARLEAAAQGADGDFVSLPTGKTEIRYSNRLKTFR